VTKGGRGGQKGRTNAPGKLTSKRGGTEPQQVLPQVASPQYGKRIGLDQECHRFNRRKEKKKGWNGSTPDLGCKTLTRELRVVEKRNQGKPNWRPVKIRDVKKLGGNGLACKKKDPWAGKG